MSVKTYVKWLDDSKKSSLPFSTLFFYWILYGDSAYTSTNSKDEV